MRIGFTRVLPLIKVICKRFKFLLSYVNKIGNGASTPCLYRAKETSRTLCKTAVVSSTSTDG